MAAGEMVDRVVGFLSRGLHGLRGASHNTVEDLGPYLDLTPAQMFPAPVAPRDVRRHRNRLTVGPRASETLHWHSQHVPLCPHYRARHANEYWLNQRVTAKWMHPRSGPRDKALIYVHGWLEPGPWIEEATLLPSFYDTLGVDVLHVQLPFHGSRNPRSALFHGEFFWSADLVRSLEAVRQSVLDVQTLIAYLRAEGVKEIGVTGLSMGGSVTMVLACVDPLPDYIVPMIAHLQLGEAVEDAAILWRMKSDLERFGVDRARRAEIFSRLPVQTLRPRLPPNHQLWVAALEDQYLTRELVERQWREWGEPLIEWIPGGHMTFPIAVPRVLRRLKTFHDALQTPAVAAAG